jgi:hypothetical protein
MPRINKRNYTEGTELEVEAKSKCWAYAASRSWAASRQEGYLTPLAIQGPELVIELRADIIDISCESYIF